MAGYDSFRSIGPIMANVNAAGLRTALRRRNLGAEFPLVAETCRSIGVYSYFISLITPKLSHLANTLFCQSSTSSVPLSILQR